MKRSVLFFTEIYDFPYIIKKCPFFYFLDTFYIQQATP